MSVVEDLLRELDAGTRKAAREVVSGRPSQASCDGGGAKGSTPKALEAPGSVGDGTDGVKCPVLFTQVARCDDCPWTCCEADGTCWKAERDERDRLKAAGELDTTVPVYAAPWSKRAQQMAEARLVRLAEEQEEKRLERVEAIKAESKPRKWGSKPIGGNSPRFVEPKPTPTEALAGKRVTKPKRGVKMGRPRLISDEQFDVAFERLEQGSTARGIAHESWQEWGYASPESAYMGLRKMVVQSGRGWPGKHTKEAA